MLKNCAPLNWYSNPPLGPPMFDPRYPLGQFATKCPGKPMGPIFKRGPPGPPLGGELTSPIIVSKPRNNWDWGYPELIPRVPLRLPPKVRKLWPKSTRSVNSLESGMKCPITPKFWSRFSRTRKLEFPPRPN